MLSSPSWIVPTRLYQLPLMTKHRRVPRLQNLAVAQIHVHAARQARIKAAHGAHDVDALELVRPVLLKDWRVLHRVFVGTRRSINVPRIGVPRRRRIRMVVCDFSIANHYVVRKDPAYRFVEATTNGVLRHGEFIPRPGPAGV